MSYLYHMESCGHVVCISSGSLATSVVWMRDGIHLTTDGSSNYTFFRSITDRAASVYTNILVANKMVAGNYSCTVSNDLGSTSRVITVDTGELKCDMP